MSAVGTGGGSVDQVQAICPPASEGGKRKHLDSRSRAIASDVPQVIEGQQK